MPAGEEVLNDGSLLLDVVKLAIPAVIGGLVGLVSALVGVHLGAQAAVKTARLAWEWDAKREGYLQLFVAAHGLGDEAGVVVRTGQEGGQPALDAAREKYRMAFATLTRAAVVARITASTEGEAATNDLLTYARQVLNPFLNEGVPDVLRWKHEIEGTLLRKIAALEAAVRSDLETDR